MNGERPSDTAVQRMSHYKSNLRDIQFNLFEVLRRQDLLGQPPYDELDEETVRGILGELERLATGPLAESFADGDRHPPTFDPDARAADVRNLANLVSGLVRQSQLDALRPDLRRFVELQRAELDAVASGASAASRRWPRMARTAYGSSRWP